MTRKLDFASGEDDKGNKAGRVRVKERDARKAFGAFVGVIKCMCARATSE